MLIWSGKGIFVPLILLFSLVILLMGCDLLSVDTVWAVNVFMFLAGLLIYLLARSIDKDKGQMLLDPESGEEVILKKEHSFFFIPVKYWAYISVTLGVWFTAQEIFDFFIKK